MQGVSIHAAQPFQTDTLPSWQRTGGGLWYSHDFGFGKADAHRLVTLARNWTLLGPSIVHHLPLVRVEREIPQSEHGLSCAITVDPDQSPDLVPGPFSLEHVTMRVNIAHARRGDLEIFLTSPSGTRAQLATQRPEDHSSEGLRNWTFMTLAFWNEPVSLNFYVT